ncbi:MAG: cation transporting ATPase C-terminal domain-containing protein, partial [Pseudomonadota bacterium]
LSVLAFRSLHLPCWKIGLASNPLLLLALIAMLAAQVAAVYWPPLQVLLKTVALDASHWSLIALLALPLVVLPEAIKTGLLFLRRPVHVA